VIGHAASLQAIRDRYGNETRLTWSATNTFGAEYGNLLRITSPNGRWIEFTYDSATPVNHVTQAKDNIGRTVTYAYDANGRLQTVTDPENNVTTYTWDASNRMTSIRDGRGIVYVTNQYDTNNRVTQQTLADPGATYTFAYTTSVGSITQTDVTDPRGHIERFVFNADHYVTSKTDAYRTSLARTTTTTRQAGSNLPTAVVDGLNRRTEYTYDTSGHALTETRLAGTANAATRGRSDRRSTSRVRATRPPSSLTAVC
jgi:YD repeat-containing protein